MKKVSNEVKDLIRVKFPDLFDIMDCEPLRENREQWSFGPFERLLSNEEIDEVLSNTPLVKKKNEIFNRFNEYVFSNFDCFQIGKRNKENLVDYRDSVDIYDHIYELSESEFKKIKYHENAYGSPDYSFVIPELDVVYEESFDLLSIIYVLKDNPTNIMLKQIINRYGMNVLEWDERLDKSEHSTG